MILPALLEQSHTRVWMKGLVRVWCRSVAWALGLHSYLLGDDGDEEDASGEDTDSEAGDEGEEPQEEREGREEREAAPVFNDLGAVHQALIPREGRIGVQPYHRPQWFHLRLVGTYDY